MLSTQLIDFTTKHMILDSLFVTESSLERMQGLLGKKKLTHSDGLLILPCNSVHTFFMKYSIDVVYLNKLGEILKIVPSLKPWRLSFCLRAASTLELTKDAAASLNLHIGQKLAW
ncbi:MAG: DUF192 domain-containing protein [Gammaproteobacteria bacterium]|nr:DUF192 domain-containing protein [Gammaproteobacteria bacterium]